jgi:hypothetical protein
VPQRKPVGKVYVACGMFFLSPSFHKKRKDCHFIIGSMDFKDKTRNLKILKVFEKRIIKPLMALLE